MATQIAKAYVQIIPSAEGIKGSLTEMMEGEVSTAGVSIGDKLGGLISKHAGALVAAGIAATVTAAGVKAVSTIKEELGDLASYGDEIDKMSQKMGLSAEAYQEWDAIMQHSGTSINTMQSGMKTLANAVENGNKAFERLGMNQEEISSMSNEDLFAATISALQDVDNETERTYLAGQLLGRGATELGALLNTSAEDTEAMRQRVHELGGVMSDDAVKAAAAYQDNLQDMQTAIQGFTRGALAELLPSASSIMGGLTEIFTGHTEEGAKMISEGMSGITKNIIDALPEVVSAAFQIGKGILGAIFLSIPEMLEAGFNMVESLADGMGEAEEPTLIDKVVEVAKKILSTIAKHLPDLLIAGVKLIVELAKGLIKAIPDMVAAIPDIIKALIDGFKERASEFLSIGSDIIEGIKNGILGAIGKIKDAAKEAANKALNAAKEFLGINSPSRVFRDDIGKNMGLGLAEGISASENAVSKAIDELSAGAVKEFDADFGLQTKFSGGLVTENRDTGDTVGAILKIGNAIIAELRRLPQPTVYINDRDIFEAYKRGARLEGASLTGV